MATNEPHIDNDATVPNSEEQETAPNIQNPQNLSTSGSVSPTHLDEVINLKKDTPEEQCPPSSPPLRRSKRNIPEDSTSPIKKNPRATRISNSQLILPKAITAPPPIPRLKRKRSDLEPIPLSPPSPKRKRSDLEPIPLSPPSPKRKHSDSEPIPLSPPSRKRKLATEMDAFTTPPTSPTKHSMCLRNSPKSSQPQTPTPKDLKSVTEHVFKTPRRPLLISRICRKRTKLEFNPPSPDKFTPLSEFFDYDDITARSAPVPRIPPIPPSHRKSTKYISLDHLICEEEFV